MWFLLNLGPFLFQLGTSGEPKTSSEETKKDSEDGTVSDVAEELELLSEMIQTPQYHARPFQVSFYIFIIRYSNKY